MEIEQEMYKELIARVRREEFGKQQQIFPVLSSKRKNFLPYGGQRGGGIAPYNPRRKLWKAKYVCRGP